MHVQSSATTIDRDALVRLLRSADSNINLGGAPSTVLSKLTGARSRVAAVDKCVAHGSHQDYWSISRERYSHYVAAAMAFFGPEGTVLDVGNAPGHVAYLLASLGHDITGLNLNAAWRATYPVKEWLDLFKVREVDIENRTLPFRDHSFDVVVFTEVLEHIAIKNPTLVLKEFQRVLKPHGLLLFSTPNVCNISNVVALLSGENVFSDTDLFYGGLDRHNREFTPDEVRELFAEVGFTEVALWGMCDHANWRKGRGARYVYETLGDSIDRYALMRNTIVGVFTAPE